MQTFAVLTFLLNFIPAVGLLVAVLLPVPIIYLSPDACFDSCCLDITTNQTMYCQLEDSDRVPFSWKVLAVFIPYVGQLLTSNFIEPLVFGRRLHLHPIFVLFSLVFWNMLWGTVGAVLSIPIMCVLKIILLNMPNRTATFLAGVMEGHIETSAIQNTSARLPRVRTQLHMVSPPRQPPPPQPPPSASQTEAVAVARANTGAFPYNP